MLTLSRRSVGVTRLADVDGFLEGLDQLAFREFGLHQEPLRDREALPRSHQAVQP